LAFAGPAGGTRASTIHFSFQGYANNVKVIAPLVGPWQLGVARIRGSGTLGSGQLRGVIADVTDPLYSRYKPASMRAEVIGYSYVGGAHGAYTKLTLTVEITSAAQGGPRCEPGTRGIVTLYDSAAKLSNGERSDYVVMGRWAALPDLRPGVDERGRRPADQPRARRPAARRPVGRRQHQDQLRSVRETLRAELVERPLGLLEPVEPHPLEDPRRLRELDVAVVHDLKVIPPRVAEVVVADHLRAGLSRGGECRLTLVHHEPDVAVLVGRLRAAAGNGEELIAHVDERDRVAVASPQREVEDPAVEVEGLVDVADLDRHVIDSDESRHGNQATRHGVRQARC